jgi:hypothetical protein
MSPGPMTTAHRGGLLYSTRAGAPAMPSHPPRVAPPFVPAPAPAHQGRGNGALALADRIAAQARAAIAREDVTPEMEPDNPSLTTEEPDEDWTDNEDVTDELEPFDPSIESALRVTVTGDESSVTITAEEGETIVAVTEDEHGNVEVEVEDTADVLL